MVVVSRESGAFEGGRPRFFSFSCVGRTRAFRKGQGGLFPWGFFGGPAQRFEKAAAKGRAQLKGTRHKVESELSD